MKGVFQVWMLELHTLRHHLILVLLLMQVLVNIYLISLFSFILILEINTAVPLDLLIFLLPVFSFLHLVFTVLALTLRIASYFI